jgi:hypothetical protein
MVAPFVTPLNVDVHGICHVASPFHFKPEDNERDLLLPAIKGTTSILTSALKASSLKRVVITSTMATISHIGKGVWPGKVYNVCFLLALFIVRKTITIQRHGKNVLVIRMHISCILLVKLLLNEKHGSSSSSINLSGILSLFILHS